MKQSQLVGLLWAVSMVTAQQANAASIGGVEFPQGEISFADAVVKYTPVISSGNPTEPNRGSDNALGVPDYVSGDCNGALTSVGCPYVSLGQGGVIVLQFIDNKLTLSGDSALDLWIFEVGAVVEDTFVDISIDGLTWYKVGKVFGSTAGIDIDTYAGTYGFTSGDLFAFVRLTDDPAENTANSPTSGADIDAVGAISTVTSPVPVPAAAWLFGSGLLALVGMARRKAA